MNANTMPLCYPASIGWLPHGFAEIAARRFGRLLQAGAVGGEQPAVERAAQAAILGAAVRQVGAAVGAVTVEQSVPPGGVAEQHQVLAQQAHGA